MGSSVRQRLSDRLGKATKAEKAIANYMLANLNDLPFETAGTLARKVGVSEPTIGRFCRAAGYRHLKALKAEIKADIGGGPWLIGDRLREFRERGRGGQDDLARSLELEIAALVNIYELPRTKEWKRAVRRLAHARQVFVAGFQTERGLAQYFVSQFQYLRRGVRLLDLAAGNFSEVLLEEPKDSCLVLFEARRHSRLARLLAAEAKLRRIPTTLITDPFCDWGRDLVDEMFVVQTEINLFWDWTAPMASLVGLLINDIFDELGPTVDKRMNEVSALYSRFVGYVGDANGPIE